MTDSSMKDAMREAFSKKVGKTFANNNYVAFNNVESFEIGVYRMVLAEQLMRFYNAIESSAYDYRDQIQRGSMPSSSNSAYEFGRGYLGEE